MDEHEYDHTRTYPPWVRRASGLPDDPDPGHAVTDHAATIRRLIAEAARMRAERDALVGLVVRRWPNCDAWFGLVPITRASNGLIWHRFAAREDAVAAVREAVGLGPESDAGSDVGPDAGPDAGPRGGGPGGS